MQKYYKKLLIAIVIFGFFIRVVSLDSMPPALNWDEISHGYNAYSILKTGSDEWGEVLPLDNFRAYGDYPLPLNLYLTIPSILVFGLNEVGIRFPHALLGTLTILVTYFLVRGVGWGRGVGLFASLIVAVSPWTFFTSRAVFQSNVSIFLLCAGLAAFFNRKSSPVLLPLSALLLGISAYAYHNSRIFVPFLVLGIIIVYRKELYKLWENSRRIASISLIVLAVLFLPLIPILTGGEGKARAKWVFIIDQAATNEINSSRGSSSLPPTLAKLRYNKATYFAQEFTTNYISYLSPWFLFTEGGTQYQFSIPQRGLLYLANMPFFYLGLFYLFNKIRKKPEHKVLALWLFLGIIPAAITAGSYHVIRASSVVPLPQILVALGVVTFWRWWIISAKGKVSGIKYYLPPILYVIIILFSFANYLSEYKGIYREKYSWAWQYGYKDALAYVKDHYEEYDRIIITKKYGEPHEFVLFYSQWDPEKYKNDPNLIRFGQSDWFWVDRFDKFYFVNDWQIPNKGGEWKMESGGTIPTNGKTLLVTSPGNYPPDWNKQATINFLDGSPAFEILRKDD